MPVWLDLLFGDGTWRQSSAAGNHRGMAEPTTGRPTISESSESFPGGSISKEPTCNAGDLGLIPGLGRFPGEGNGNLLQYSCLRNPRDRGAW